MLLPGFPNHSERGSLMCRIPFRCHCMLRPHSQARRQSSTSRFIPRTAIGNSSHAVAVDPTSITQVYAHGDNKAPQYLMLLVQQSQTACVRLHFHRLCVWQGIDQMDACRYPGVKMAGMVEQWCYRALCVAGLSSLDQPVALAVSLFHCFTVSLFCFT